MGDSVAVSHFAIICHTGQIMLLRRDVMLCSAGSLSRLVKVTPHHLASIRTPYKIHLQTQRLVICVSRGFAVTEARVRACVSSASYLCNGDRNQGKGLGRGWDGLGMKRRDSAHTCLNPRWLHRKYLRKTSRTLRGIVCCTARNVITSCSILETSRVILGSRAPWCSVSVHHCEYHLHASVLISEENRQFDSGNVQAHFEMVRLKAWSTTHSWIFSYSQDVVLHTDNPGGEISS